MQSLSDRQRAEMDALEQRQARERAKLESEQYIRSLLPENPEPCFVCAIKLYGAVASVKYGDGYARMNPEERQKPRTLREAIDIVEALGDIVPMFTVKSGCLAMKPETAITEQERERATICGPYACRVVNRHGQDCRLEAFVMLPSEQLIYVGVILDSAARSKFGHWRRTGGYDHYPESWTYEPVWPTDTLAAKTVKYAAGWRTGQFSGGQLVYLYTFLSDLELEH